MVDLLCSTAATKGTAWRPGDYITKRRTDLVISAMALSGHPRKRIQCRFRGKSGQWKTDVTRFDKSENEAQLPPTAP